MSKYLSPAKINWFLHITGRRDDGYHLLETVFQRIDWCDELTITPRSDGQIVLTGDLSGVAMTQNLAYHAAKALQSAPNHGVNIHLTKSIPTGAGLGGGSSNAATTLVALNELWDLNFSNLELQKIGLNLGADVPFFVSGYNSAFASGIGEVLRPLDLPKRPLLLVNPNVHVATAAVFNHPNLVRNHAALTHMPTDFTALSNDLQQATFALNAQVHEVYKQLTLTAPNALVRMSGSGATVFAAPNNETERMQLMQWPAHDWQSIWTSTQ